MKKIEIKQLIKNLCQRKNEEEWFKFKENWYEPHEIGEYISALSNSAAIKERGTSLIVSSLKEKLVLSGNALKVIAIIAMTIDHLA